VGVIGPLRMPYAYTISAVRFISQLLTNLLSELYHDPEPSASAASGALTTEETDSI